MKTIKVFLLALCMPLVFACTSHEEKLTRTIENFSYTVEHSSQSFSAEQWMNVAKQCKNLTNQVSMAFDRMTEDEKQRSMAALGRCYGTLAKQSMCGVKQKLEDALDNVGLLPSFMQGFAQGLGADTVNSFLQSGEESIQSLNATLESLESVLDSFLDDLDTADY